MVSSFNLSATEIYSLFAVGNLKHKGIPWVIFDGDEDLCMSRGTECPFPRCCEYIFEVHNSCEYNMSVCVYQNIRQYIHPQEEEPYS